MAGAIEQYNVQLFFQLLHGAIQRGVGTRPNSSAAAANRPWRSMASITRNASSVSALFSHNVLIQEI